MVFRYLDKFQFVEQNSVECPCDLGANLVQHFMRRYSRYSRYRTKSHDKATISHDITRYSRYQTVLLKLEEIITITSKLPKTLRFREFFLVLFEHSSSRKFSYMSRNSNHYCRVHNHKIILQTIVIYPYPPNIPVISRLLLVDCNKCIF